MRFVLIYIVACVTVSLATGFVIYPFFAPPLDPVTRLSATGTVNLAPKTTAKTFRVRQSCVAPTECAAYASSESLADLLAARFPSADMHAVPPQPPLELYGRTGRHEEKAL
jgi:hypothetical protein